MLTRLPSRIYCYIVAAVWRARPDLITDKEKPCSGVGASRIVEQCSRLMTVIQLVRSVKCQLVLPTAGRAAASEPQRYQSSLATGVTVVWCG